MYHQSVAESNPPVDGWMLLIFSRYHFDVFNNVAKTVILSIYPQLDSLPQSTQAL
jgi:hypothetical protein